MLRYLPALLSNHHNTKYFINCLCHSLAPRSEGGRQGRALANNLLDFSAASLDPATGLKCVAAAGAVAGLERERLLSCTHSSITVCHFTYVTRFRSAPATVCEEIYTKNCNIVFSKQAQNETLEHCYFPMELDCEGSGGGEATCQTVWESSCVTRYQAAPALPTTDCQKIPVELCGAPACQPRPGARTCHQKVLTSVQEVPEESCDIVPSKICKGRFQTINSFQIKRNVFIFS